MRIIPFIPWQNLAKTLRYKGNISKECRRALGSRKCLTGLPTRSREAPDWCWGVLNRSSTAGTLTPDFRTCHTERQRPRRWQKFHSQTPGRDVTLLPKYPAAKP